MTVSSCWLWRPGVHSLLVGPRMEYRSLGFLPAESPCWSSHSIPSARIVCAPVCHHTWLDQNTQLLHPCRHFFFPLSGGGGRESEEKLQTPGLSLSSPPTPQRRSPGGEEDARATAGRRGDNARSPHSEPGAGRPTSKCSRRAAGRLGGASAPRAGRRTLSPGAGGPRRAGAASASAVRGCVGRAGGSARAAGAPQPRRAERSGGERASG